jgi:hypothetical protein
MKTLYAYILAFGAMTGICFVLFSGLALFLPLIGAVIAWDLALLAYDWSVMLLWARLIFIASAFIGVMFVCSKEGQSMAKDILNG